MPTAGRSRMAKQMTTDQRPTIDDQRPQDWRSVIGRWSLVLCCALLLSACLLTSGERPSIDTLPDGGNISTTFVGAEGSSERSIDTGMARANLNAIVIVQAERGELRVELLNPDRNLVFSVQRRPDEQVTRSGTVQTDDQGRLYYRVIARGARNGGYQVLYQRTVQ
jgi:hypothetical protein